MALNRRVMLGVAILMAFVVVAVLPPRSCSEVDQWTLTSTALCGGMRYPWSRGHRAALDQARYALSRRLLERGMADSLRALADAGRGVQSADGSVVVLHEEPLSADSARVWLALAVGERDRIAAGRPHARIVVALGSRPPRARSEQSVEARRTSNAGWQTRRFTSVSGADTTCFVVLRINDRTYSNGPLTETDDRGRYGAFLGSCGLVGRFGAPNTGALRATRYAFEDERGPFARPRSTMVSERTDGPRTVNPTYYQLVGCLKSDTGACAVLVGLDTTGTRMWFGPGLFVSRGFLSYLLDTEGADKFQQFWESPLNAERAFSGAFGRPASEAVRAWVQHDYRLPPGGDQAVGAVTLAALGWLGAALAAAIAIGMYRQAGA